MSRTDCARMEEVKEYLKDFCLDLDDYKDIMNSIYDSMSKGLDPETREEASIKMYPSYVCKLPNGYEKGHFVALDLGGTNYRVLLIHFPGEKEPAIIEERMYVIPQHVMLGPGEGLFDYIADTLAQFLQGHGLSDRCMSLGFTFSFPCQQIGLETSILMRWTKGFCSEGVVGRNVAELLQIALDKKGCNIKCKAIVNDTVGTLASCAIEDNQCAIGLIIGTGTNAAYTEKVKNIHSVRDKHDFDKNGDKMVINTEWGAFGEHDELKKYRTRFDENIDKETLHPGQNLFEKLSSGKYIGELVRLILVDLVNKEWLFRGKLPKKLNKPNGFMTKYMTETERDPPHLFYSTNYMMTEDLHIDVYEPIDAKIIRYVCEIVSTRAAHLIGAGIAAILHRLKNPMVTVGIDGSLYKFHPKFRERMVEIIHQLKPEETKFHLRLSEDGSGKGAAAIVAALLRA